LGIDDENVAQLLNPRDLEHISVKNDLMKRLLRLLILHFLLLFLSLLVSSSSSHDILNLLICGPSFFELGRQELLLLEHRKAEYLMALLT
jgi:hypothetical protein